MDLDPNNMLASLLLGSIALALLYYAKSRRRLPQAVVGGLMMVYPYFVDDAGLNLGIGAVLLVLLFAATKLGL